MFAGGGGDPRPIFDSLPMYMYMSISRSDRLDSLLMKLMLISGLISFLIKESLYDDNFICKA